MKVFKYYLNTQILAEYLNTKFAPSCGKDALYGVRRGDKNRTNHD